MMVMHVLLLVNDLPGSQTPGFRDHYLGVFFIKQENYSIMLISADHSPRVGKMVEIGSGAERYVEDYDYHHLSPNSSNFQ
jgi:hypothetical protein